MGASNSNARPKFEKPYPEFPLFPHATGRWAKKVCGKLHYFGKCADDPKGEAALAEWNRTCDDRRNGRKPRPKDGELTVKGLLNRFLAAKELAADNGEITRRTFHELRYGTVERVRRVFGFTTRVIDLRPEDFERLRADMKGLALSTQGLEIARARSIFNYAYAAGLIDRPMRFGPSFKVPSTKALRKSRQAARQNGLKMFEAAEIREMLKHSRPTMRAMILLGINCGFGNNDLATLRWSAVDLDNGWVEHARPKTGADRRCPLWPETIAALEMVRDHRPDPRSKADADRVFLTQNGLPFVRFKEEKGEWADAIGATFYRVMERAGLQRAGRGFYALRHTFETIAGDPGDQVAVDYVMGHLRGDMASVYRERIDDKRLRKVVDHVRGWLFPTPAETW